MTVDKAFKILQPKYYSKFKCDPIQCHETCCERWKIIIDKRTYEKYTQSQNETIQGIIKTGLSLNKESRDDDDFAIINLDKDMVCPFLNQNALCEIFTCMGESSLSKTCKTYPRAVILMKDRIERGLEMSCSVAAELALLNKKGIEFEYVMDTVDFNDIYIISPTIDDLKQIQLVQEIRTTAIEILQRRTMELSERLATVGYFLNEIRSHIDFSAPRYEEALSRIKETKSFINQEKFNITQQCYQEQNRQPFYHLNNMLSMKFEEGDSIRFFSKRYIECLMQVLDTFGRIKNKELEKEYRKNYEKYLKSYMDKKSYILENFFVNYIFVYGIEFFKLNDIWTFYLKLCVVYGLIKFNLVGLATYHKGMNDDLLLKLIQSLSKTIITDRTYLEAVIKYLEDKKLDEFPKLMTLITD